MRPALFCWNFNYCHLHIRKANSHEKVCTVYDAYFNNAARAIEGDKNFQPLCRKIIDDAGTGVCVTSIATHTCRRNQDAVHLNQYTQVAKLSRITKICNSRSYVIRFELQIYFRLAYANQNKHQVNATCLFHRGTIFVDKIKLFQNFIIIILRLQWNIFHILYPGRKVDYFISIRFSERPDSFLVRGGNCTGRKSRCKAIYNISSIFFSLTHRELICHMPFAFTSINVADS